MSEGKSIVVITGDGPEHKYVTNLICAAVPVSAIFVLHPVRGRRPRLFQRGVSAFLDKLLWRAFLLAIGDGKRRQASVQRVLGEARCAQFTEPDKLIHMTGASTAELAEAVKTFRPEIIAVYGTSKIPDAVLDVAGQVALNMHTGISPNYRGTACAFWPIVENDPEHVGATVHQCTSAMDGGVIFATRQADLVQGDDLHAVFARAVKAGGVAYTEVLRAAREGPLTGTPQDLTIGREYRGYMRGIRGELKARRNLARMHAAWRPESQDAPEEAL